ncbi:hypothetical protein NDU88_006140 [Pleurodeles waltl]|uniref:Uncharacterized protein n=1 Tax=Pleurodeles waltl TaxID=8319 RepID=A0AAV7UK54_PLEWA|nr:hypothetical protein NDU88_006140 [Pleurodeles waltl]
MPSGIAGSSLGEFSSSFLPTARPLTSSVVFSPLLCIWKSGSVKTAGPARHHGNASRGRTRCGNAAIRTLQ